MKNAILIIDVKEIIVQLNEKQLKQFYNKPVIFKPTNGKTSYYINNGVYPSKDWDDREIESYSRSFTVFPTGEAAQLAVDIQKAKNKVRYRIAELNEGWAPDFTDNTTKYNIIIENNNSLNLSTSIVVKVLPSYMYLKTRDLADQLIKEMPKELKLILSE